MSHIATSWAFDQPERFPDMKPTEWAVLLVLADCHNPVKGCFPSQSFIKKRTNLGERTVRDMLHRLRDRGLIDWEEERDGNRRDVNRYKMAFEPDFEPAESAGRSTGRLEQGQPANHDTLNRQDLPVNPVREPVREPERESAQARDCPIPQDDGLSSDGRGLDDMRAAYPGSRQDSQREIAEAWDSLSPAERTQAFEGLDDFLAERAGLRLKRVYLQTYLSERRFARPSAPVGPDGKVAGGTAAGKGASGTARTGPAKPYFPPFDRAWWVIVHRWTAAARTGADIHRVRAVINMAVTASSGISLDPSEAPGAEDCAAFVQVWAGGEEFDAWAAWFRRRGVSLPNRDRIWCWFPQRWPPEEPAGDGTADEAVGF